MIEDRQFQNYGNSLAGRAIGTAEVGLQRAQNVCGPQEGCTADRSRDATVTVAVDVRATRNFADALMHARDGKRITRAGWNARGQHVEAQYPDKGSRMSAPYLVLKNAQNELVPWVPSQGDLFASDWALLP